MIYHKQQQTSSSSESGFTIIESLMAIIVAGILLAAIAPVIVLSVATRVQARRVELASDAAKTYIDGVKSGKIPAPPITKKDPSATTEPPPPDAPSGTLTCSTANDYCSSPTTSSDKVYCIDGDNTGTCTNDSTKDMIVQAFGYNLASNSEDDGYKLGIRVYRSDAFKPGITLKASKEGTNTENKQDQTFSGGTGLKPNQLPLVETTTEISKKSTTFNDFCERLEDQESDPLKKNPQSQC